MAILQSYFRIITPASRQKQYTQLHTDSDDLNKVGGAASTSISWYSQVMKGAGSRMQRYIQYDSMDNDIDVARALDIIAEETSNDDAKSNLPFVIEYQTEDNEDISDSIITTLRAAVRQWSKLQDLNNRIFRISRVLVKYGDCFFQKDSDTKKWNYVDPSKVIGIELNKNNERVSYHMRGTGGTQLGFGAKQADVEVIPAGAIVHFSLSDDMGDSMPFGESVLQPVFRTFKQLSMLEDSVIVYRLTRAPERRVFYVDVGNVPPQRVKQYLENIKNELRQKRIPNTASGPDTIDGTYNPSSISEDFYFPVTSSGRSSRVEVLPGGENLGELAELKYFKEKIFRGLRIPSSYMSSSDSSPQGAQYVNGKTGTAYIEELRFANYVRRIQNKVECIMDAEFKLYLSSINLNIEDWLFTLRLPEPQNFAIQAQNALDSDLINSYKSIEDVKHLSARFKMKRYLGLTEDEIQMNELMLKQELNIDESANVDAIQQIYDPVQLEARKPTKILDRNAMAKAAKKEANADQGGDEGGQPDAAFGADEDIGGMPDMGLG
jgi:hypothetical protein